jgi:hypothetical protein
LEYLLDGHVLVYAAYDVVEYLLLTLGEGEVPGILSWHSTVRGHDPIQEPFPGDCHEIDDLHLFHSRRGVEGDASYALAGPAEYRNEFSGRRSP